MEGSEQPIIVIKKKAAHGHHGGAWKVAYADFVTAMMALFIVLWLLSSDEKVKQAVGGYFSDPTGNGKQMGSTLAGSGEALAVAKDDMNKLKDALESAMKQTPDFQKMSKNIQITVTGEGLRIELLEDEKGMFFESGSPKPSEMGNRLISMLAQQLGALPNKLSIEGHTDAKPFNSETYSNWELSTDRGNAARRLMQDHGVRPNQVAQVRGYADQRLRIEKEPSNPSNRRVSVIVQYLNPPPGAKTEAPSKDEAHGKANPAAAPHDEKKPDAGHGEKKPASGHD